MIYLDHAATSLPRLAPALEAWARGASLPTPGRGLSSAAMEASGALEEARASVRALCGFGAAVFTSGATHALNQAILGMRPRPTRVALDPLAHNAARRPCLAVGASLWTLPHDEVGRIDVARARREWIAGTELVVVGHGSNVTGLVQPVAALAELARAKGAKVVVDAAQTAGVLDLREALGHVSAVAFSAHKGLRGLPGAGALVVRDELELEPLFFGGTGSDALDDDMPADAPARFEAGTPNLPGALALGAAAAAFLETGPAYDVEATRAALLEAVSASGATIVGRGALPVVAFEGTALSPRELAEVLDRAFHIHVRAGLHCAPAAHRVLGTLARGGAVRISGGSATTSSDVLALKDALAAMAR